MKKKRKTVPRFCCPHCLVVQVKSPGIQMLTGGGDEVVRGAFHLDVIECADQLRCSRCQGLLETKRLVAGDYDYGGWIVDGPALAGIALMAVLRWGGGLGWGISISIAAGLAWASWCVISRWQKRHIKACKLKP